MKIYLKKQKSVIQIKLFLILLNIELIFPSPRAVSLFSNTCAHLWAKEKEGKRKEDTGADLSSSAPSACFKALPTLFENANNS